MKICSQCKKQFKIPQAEKDFLQKIDMVDPSLCPACRMQWRFAWRNERMLYHRKCDLTGKQIISVYAPDSKYKVYDQHEWYTDKWDGMQFGRNFDFNRPFFEQFKELMLDTPKISVFVSKNENSDYTNGAQQDKNCYMIFVSDHDQDCYYSYAIDSCSDCIDCLNCYKCTLCLECIDCSSSYNLAYCEKTHDSRDSCFLYDCKNCENCFGCFGLRGAKYHILNEKFTKEEYEKRIKALDIGNYELVQKMRSDIENRRKTQQIHQYYDGNNNLNVTGDHIVHCKNCIECYDSGDLEDCGHLIFSFKSKDCFDGHVVVDNCQFCYGTISTINQYNTQFTFVGFYSKNSMYLDHCLSCQDCFGCSGLKHKQYCIFNKQYSKEEYEALRAKIIEHMKKKRAHGASAQANEVGSRGSQPSEAELKNQEWGMPLPPSLSPFGYNETVAQEFFPLSEVEIKNLGWNWHKEDKDQIAVYQGPKAEIPNNIKDADKNVTEKIFTCEKCAKPYKIIPHELKLYKDHEAPLPHMCFNDRHLARICKRNPRQLWERACQKCGEKIFSTFNPSRPETVYCEECYLKTIY